MGKRFIAVASRRFITHHNSAVSLLETREEEGPILEQRERTKASRISAARMREVLGPTVADRL